MPIFHPFEPGDVITSVLHAKPPIRLGSGSNGWYGNTGPSGSLSLYGGVRSRFDVSGQFYSKSGVSIYPLVPVNTHTIDGVVFLSGSYPATGSVQLVTVRTATPGPALSISSTDWYQEHWSPIDLLYRYYSRFSPDLYFTGSYAHYSLYFKQLASYQAMSVEYSGSYLNQISSSMTAELWAKPRVVTSTTRDFTLMSQRNRWKFYITGSTGKLAFTDYKTFVTSSAAVPSGSWHHIALTVGLGSASFYLDDVGSGQAAFTGTLTATTAASLEVGAEVVVSGSAFKYDQGFDGFLFETRIWDQIRTTSQLSGAFKRMLSGSESGSVRLRHYSRFDDGPLSTAHGFSMGSGAFDYSPVAIHGAFKNFGSAFTPMWQPNDHSTFVVIKKKILLGPATMKVIHVPSIFYGRQLASGSVDIRDRTYDNQGIIRVLRDDGRGGLYISGSITRNIGAEDYRGVRWNKVGNVFYAEGIIVITDPSLLDIGGVNANDWSQQQDLLGVAFQGTTRIPTVTLSCRLPQTQLNASGNPRWRTYDASGRPVRKGPDNTTYVTAIGLYGPNRELLGVAKLAQPIRKRETDRIMIRLQLDW